MVFRLSLNAITLALHVTQAILTFASHATKFKTISFCIIKNVIRSVPQQPTSSFSNVNFATRNARLALRLHLFNVPVVTVNLCTHT